MPVDVRIVESGVATHVARLGVLAAHAEDVRPAWPGVRAEWFKANARAFRSEGASTAGGAWAPLARSTAAGRASAGYPAFHPILVRTGSLRRSLTQAGGEHLTIGTPSSLALGSSNPTYPYHTSTRPRQRLPRRAFDLTESDRKRLLVPLRLHLVRTERGLGSGGGGVVARARP